MIPSKHAANPERLVDGRFGRLLREANRGFAGDLDQRGAFQRVTERLAASRTVLPSRNYWLLPAILAVFAGLVALPTFSAFVPRLRPADTSTLVAEDLAGFNTKSAAVSHASNTGAAASEAARTQRLENKRAPDAKPNAPGSRIPALASSESRLPRSVAAPREEMPSAVPEPIVNAPSAVVVAATSASAESAAPDCLSLARLGQTRDAEACFLKRAEGSGLGAEMALYEVARLRRDVLADAAGALGALADYRRRFPAGSLRREADMSQLELLLQLGRSDEALQLSDDLLSSSTSGERAAELHLLRGHILRKAQARFTDAAHEYELAERAGMRGGDITYYRALCLEALGRAPEAAALLALYLEQPQRSYAEDARRRLEKLKQ